MRCKGMGIFFLLQAFPKKSFNFVAKLNRMDNKEHYKSKELGQIINIPLIADARGSLCVAENAALPFEVKRVFWIFGVPEGQTRGCHAHKTCAEVVFPVTGSFEIEVDDGTESITLLMDSPNQGIHIPPNVWCRLKNFAPGTACVVLASQEYDAEGYINR